MKRTSLFAVSFIFTAFFALSAFAQTGAQPAPGRIGWIDTGAFGDDKEGVTKYINAAKALEAELKPRQNELIAIQTKGKSLSEEYNKMAATTGVPIDEKALAAKQDEIQKLQRDFDYKKKDFDAVAERRQNEVLGPISADIMKAVQEYAKQKGYSVILDIDKLYQAGVLLSFDASANITKDFVTFYNARPATASTATPR